MKPVYSPTEKQIREYRKKSILKFKLQVASVLLLIAFFLYFLFKVAIPTIIYYM